MITMRHFQVIGIFCVFLAASFSCKTTNQTLGALKVKRTLKTSRIFSNQFTGFYLLDPTTGEVLLKQNEALHFTPASNTKILTTLACLTHLKDSLPFGSTYLMPDSTACIQPFGDPTFLHQDFPEQPVIRKLAQVPHLSVALPDRILEPFGPGWAWDDYQYSFQSERCWMPIYGNEVRIYSTDTLHIVPSFFNHYVNRYVGERPGSLVYRDLHYNLFNIWMEYDTSTFERKIPFAWSEELLHTLLADTLHIPISSSTDTPSHNADTLYNQATLPTLALMMQRSDNFLAEQLLITTARSRGYTNISAFRKALIEIWNLPDDIRWVDGSGLSRYNLMTPRVMAVLLQKILNHSDKASIKYIFPNGGVSGTIKHWYDADQPYVFAKTGTLSNNHCLSGYIQTRSGRWLIFSIMNNNYTHPVTDVKLEMEKLLETIRDRY